LRAIERLEATSFEPKTIACHARAFDVSRFKSQMQALVDVALNERRARSARPSASLLRDLASTMSPTAPPHDSERDAA
jgi:hypothetical protein